MADIQLRFNLDILVLSTPVTTQLDRIGIDADRDNELTLLLEPEVLDEIYALESAGGAQCVVADTAALTPARLAHSRMESRGHDLADAALAVANKHTPQHVLVEVGPCGLPLDASAQSSLVENRDQYTRAVGYFDGLDPLFDAYFLNGFTNTTDLKCALMGMRKATDKPIFASVDLDNARGAEGNRAEWLAEAVRVMAEYGAQVAGFATAADMPEVLELARRAKAVNPALPTMVQLVVREINPEQNAPTPENPYYEPDTMVEAAETLRDAGVQFLRAAGNATPSYTGALVAATLGDSVQLMTDGSMVDLDAAAAQPKIVDDSELEALAAQLRARISSALNN